MNPTTAVDLSPTFSPDARMLLIIGLAVFMGAISGRLFQRLRIPQVVGYIVLGLGLGVSGLNIIDAASITALGPFNFFALGVIGFMIGGELHRDVFRKYGWQFFTILLAEGLGAFFVVGTAVSAVMYWSTGNATQALALGMLLGAVSSATAPAATVDVLWEYRTAGVLTTTVFAIVALDDGLALLLYGLASSAAMQLTGQSGVSLLGIVTRTGYELGGAALLGVTAGWILNRILRRVVDRDKSLAFITGALMTIIGFSMLVELDVILAAMALGTTIANLAPRRSRRAFEILESFAPPIYVLFFVIVGARLNVGGLERWMWGLALAYVLGRTGGKMLGANLGARWSRAPASVRRYLGYCLFSQAGVAIGLAILAAQHFEGPVGQSILAIVTATTFLVQIIGPPAVKYAVTKAGEVGLNITEDDLAKTMTVRDVMKREPVYLTEGTPMTKVIATIASTSEALYPVVDAAGRVTGLIRLEELRTGIRHEELHAWLVAYDLMQPLNRFALADQPLHEVLSVMREAVLDHLPVLEDASSRKLAGVLSLAGAQRALAAELVKRRHAAGLEPAA